MPLPLQCAVERYEEWEESNPRATSFAKERQIAELHQLYRLERYGDLGRYSLYRRTYFSRFGQEVKGAFDRLLKRMSHISVVLDEIGESGEQSGTES